MPWILKKLLHNILAVLTKKEQNHFYWLTLLNIVVSILDVCSVALILAVIHFYTSNNGFGVPFLPAWLAQKNSPALAAVLLGFFLLKNLLAWLSVQLTYTGAFNSAARLAGQNLTHYLQGSYTSHVNTDTAVNIRQISHQPIEFAQYILLGVQQIITEAALILIAMAAILLYNARLCLIVTAVLLPVTLLAWFNTQRKIKASRQAVKVSNEAALQYLKEALNGFVESNIYGKNQFFIQRYTAHQRIVNNHIRGMQVTQAIPPRLMELFAVLGLALLITASIFTGSKNPADIITIGAFIAAAYKIIPGLVRIINAAGQIHAYAYVAEAIAIKQTVAAHAVNTAASPKIQSCGCSNVSFVYKGAPVLSNISFTIISGQLVGISGASGRGKTTLLNLLLGFLQPLQGTVCFNGQPVQPNSFEMHRQRIAYVKQQNFLLNDTIEKNITLDDGPADGTRMQEVIAATGLGSLVAQYPEGLGKMISENGKNISGGQRQRIALARALYKHADLIILDEPFNELDTASEMLLLRHFKTLAAQGKIIVLVTHQKEGLAFCDNIITLND